MAASSLFAALDKDGDGKVSASELRGCMAAALGEEEAAAIVAAADADGDGLLDRDEFLRLAREADQEADEDGRWRCLRVAFAMYADATAVEGEGAGQHITPASLQRMLSRLGSQEPGLDECRAMICRFDLDGDGVLSFDEFRVMMHDGLM
ncbi:probable calcium-binding protein CML25/26 [Phragmites australis]|uniref:probable calcium-binding protein CML25/26 n=1 Tax=Phragmites australis TaxID=29695 RepID=UPI002D793B0B|nr:probable calcium-binding protein CML25/26 [Phragmites australis]